MNMKKMLGTWSLIVAVPVTLGTGATGQSLAGQPASATGKEPGQTIHVILEATDGGTPSLTRYQRVVLTVQPAAQ